MNRFVIHKHTRADDVHWDLMLEAAEALETYRLQLPPEKLPVPGDEPVAAVRIFDHPLKFLTYEGSVNDGAGRVQAADKGTYRVLAESGRDKRFELEGKILKGMFTLGLMEGTIYTLKCEMRGSSA